jgi:hypothetical protein
VAPLPAPAVPPRFLLRAASTTPVVPHMAQASPDEPRAAAAPPAATDGPPPREWPSSPIAYTSTTPPAPKPQHAKQQTGEMVASVKDVVEAKERPVHQGSTVGFLQLFDCPRIQRLHRTPRHLLSSYNGMPLDRSSTSPDATPPVTSRPSLQLPPPACTPLPIIVLHPS